MSIKERIVFLDRAALEGDDLHIPSFDHNWSDTEYNQTRREDKALRALVVHSQGL